MEARSWDLQCPAIARSGERCKRFMNPGDDFCSQHDPRRAGQRRRSASKAGKASSPYKESREIRERILTLIEEVHSGKMKPDKAYAVSSLANVVLSSLKVDLKVKEQEDFEARLNSLEMNLAQESL